MKRPGPGQPPVEPSLEPDEGWHCSHLYYRFDRGVLAALAPSQIKEGRQALIAILNPEGENAPQRLQTSLVSGNKADFGLLVMDANPLKVEGVNQRLLSSKLGPALIPLGAVCRPKPCVISSAARSSMGILLPSDIERSKVDEGAAI